MNERMNEVITTTSKIVLLELRLHRVLLNNLIMVNLIGKNILEKHFFSRSAVSTRIWHSLPVSIGAPCFL